MKKTHGGDIWAAARATGRTPEALVDFSASVNPLGMSKSAVRAVKAALGPTVSAYPDPESVELKSAVSEYHGLPVEVILPGNGSTELIYALPGALGIGNALIVEPAFSEYRRALKLAGASVAVHTLTEKEGFAPDVKRLAPKIRSGGFDALYIANPANPTGAPVEKKILLEIADLCARSGVTLVVDEAFADFSEELSVKKEVTRRKNLVVLRSMTKFFAMAGLRLGFVFAHEQTLRRLKRHMAPWSVNTLAAAAAGASLRDSAYMSKTLSTIRRERLFLSGRLSEEKGLKLYPSAANFLMLRVSHTRVTAVELAGRLFDKGLLVRGLADFKGLGPGYLRVAVKGRKENTLLADAISAVLRA